VTDEEDRRLIERSREKDEVAFASLLQKYRSMVFHWALRFVERSEDAQDIVQEVFLKVFLGLRQYRGESKFSVWLYRITYNMSMNWLSRFRRDHLPLDEEALSRPDEPSLSIQSGPSPERLNPKTLAAIDKLPPHYRIVMVLYFAKGFTYQQISSTLNIPINTVKTHLRRAKLMLKRFLETKKR